MGHIMGMASLAAEGNHRVTATWRIPDGDSLEGLSEVLQALNPEIVQVYPTLVGQEDYRPGRLEEQTDGHGDHDRNRRSRG
jgi:hypothetical protein